MRIVDTQARRRDILLQAIEGYIKSAVPVSSDMLKDKYGINLSSATIRNVLAELEDDGFLIQPHTSAGRIPTDKGYRYYLESLKQARRVDDDQAQGIWPSDYFKQLQDLESVLEKTSDILAELTHYTSIVSCALHEDRIYFRGLHFLFEQPEFNDITRLRSFLTVLEEKARLLELINHAPEDEINIFIGKESHCDEIEGCALVVSSYANKGKSCGKLGVLGPKRMNYSRVISILDSLSKKLNQLLNEF